MFPKVKSKKIVYLDHAATTPLDGRVKKAMEPFLNDKFGNPSSLYEKGREAKAAIEEARKTVSILINAKSSEIIFTAGGTESVNLAIFGVARINTDPKTNKHGSAHLITSVIEHHCVLNSFKALEGEGHRTTFVAVDKEGFVNLEELKKSIRTETILISIMYANNEIGTVEPIAEIGKWLKKINSERAAKKLGKIFFHTDACQAASYLDLDVNRLGVDLMSVNGGKIYGPKQTGFLYVRSGTELKPLIYGGGQERDLRGGTENVSGIVGFAKAFELGQKSRNTESQRLFKLNDQLYKKIKALIPGITINGPQFGTYNKDEIKRLPNNLNIFIKDVEGEALMLYLDSYGICASTASACSTGSLDPSHVLLALGKDENQATSSIRFTLGKTTTQKDLNYLLKVLPPITSELKKMNKLK